MDDSETDLDEHFTKPEVKSPQEVEKPVEVQQAPPTEAQQVADASQRQAAQTKGQVATRGEGQTTAQEASKSQTIVSGSAGGFTEISQVKVDLHSFLYENSNPVLASSLAKLDIVEQKAGLKREHVIYVLAGLIGLYLLLDAGAAFVCNVLIGVAYPATASLRALRAKDQSKDVQLLVYWLLFAGLLVLDSFLAELPGFFLLKAVGLLALSLPQIHGSELLYTKAVEPALNRLNALLNKKPE